jgi:hypothetical protein
MATKAHREIELAPVACCTPVAAPDITPEQSGTVRGQVLAGPGCPVETAPADGSAPGGGDECADRPTAARIQVTAVNSGSVVTTVRSDTDGRFRVDLPAGQFELQALGLADPGVAGPPLLVRVRPGRLTDAVVQVDTGIR